MTLQIEAIYRYPVKGLSPERLDSAQLQAGAFFPGDRLFAVENGPSDFDPAAPQWQQKTKYLMLMRDEALARLSTRYDDATDTLRIADPAGNVIEADLSTGEGRAEVTTFLAAFAPRSVRGRLRLLRSPFREFSFTDSTKGFVSIINLASIQAVENLVGQPVDPLRFRANLYVTGLPAWAEHDLVGETLAGPEGLRLEITKRINRCAAVDVDPQTGIRDLHIPKALMRNLGHIDCGIYAKVVRGGSVRSGDELALAQPTLDL
jgi:uncharacterized protein YcbX